MGGASVAFVIPALNERGTIEGVVRAVKCYGSVIVVDDGSSDGTGDKAIGEGAVVVTHKVTSGYDKALESGFRRALDDGYAFVITLDADGQHPVDRIEEFLVAFDHGAVLVLGVRKQLQRTSERIFALLTRVLWGISDPLCGMKGYSIRLYQERGCFDSYGSIGSELAIASVRRGVNWVEVPVPTVPRVGRPRFGSVLLANTRIFRAAVLSVFKTGRSERPQRASSVK